MPIGQYMIQLVCLSYPYARSNWIDWVKAIPIGIMASSKAISRVLPFATIPGSILVPFLFFHRIAEAKFFSLDSLEMLYRSCFSSNFTCFKISFTFNNGFRCTIVQLFRQV